MNTVYVCSIMQNIRLFNHIVSFWQLENQIIQNFILFNYKLAYLD